MWTSDSNNEASLCHKRKVVDWSRAVLSRHALPCLDFFLIPSPVLENVIHVEGGKLTWWIIAITLRLCSTFTDVIRKWTTSTFFSPLNISLCGLLPVFHDVLPVFSPWGTVQKCSGERSWNLESNHIRSLLLIAYWELGEWLLWRLNHIRVIFVIYSETAFFFDLWVFLSFLRCLFFYIILVVLYCSWHCWYC